MAGTRVLLLDPAFSALPIYLYLASLDVELWVMGARQDDVLARKAGARWVEQDYSRAEDVRSWMEAHDCSLLVPGCTDVSLSIAAGLGISPFVDPPDTIDVFSNKLRFQALCRELGLPVPEAVPWDDFPRAGRYICKPADSFSGRGITIFDGGDALALAEARATARDTSPSGLALVEEFVDGQLYSYSAFLEQDEAIQSFFVKEGSSANRFAVDTSLVVRDMPAAMSAAFARYAHLISRRLSLRDGLLHVQFILRDGEPVLIEATRRCPGDLYAMLIEYSTGYPYGAKYASYFVDRNVAGGATAAQRFVVRHTVTSGRVSVNAGLRLTSPMNVVAFYPLQKMGEVLLPNQKARSGLLFVETPSSEAAGEAYDAFLARNVYED